LYRDCSRSARPLPSRLCRPCRSSCFAPLRIAECGMGVVRDQWVRAISSKKFVELVVRTDPKPLDRIGLAIAHGANIERNSDRPNIHMDAEFLKLKRVMPRVYREQAKSAACGFSLGGVEIVIRPPKCRRCSRNHNLSRSSGSLPSVLAFSMKASSFGRGRGSLMICSQCWSPCASSHSLLNTMRRSASAVP
jgi:hypothetical protein